MVYRRDEPFAQVTILDHAELDKGTLKSTLNQSGLTTADFIELL